MAFMNPLGSVAAASMQPNKPMNYEDWKASTNQAGDQAYNLYLSNANKPGVVQPQPKTAPPPQLGAAAGAPQGAWGGNQQQQAPQSPQLPRSPLDAAMGALQGDWGGFQQQQAPPPQQQQWSQAPPPQQPQWSPWGRAAAQAFGYDQRAQERGQVPAGQNTFMKMLAGLLGGGFGG